VLVSAPRLGRRVVWGLVAVFLTAFALTPVLVSHDAFSYLDYARLGVLHGLDPYVHPPDAARGDPVFARVTWTEATSAYGPLFTLATYPLAWLPVGLAVAVLKGVAALSVAALAALVARIAAWRGLEPLRAAAFLALNPLVLVHVVGGAHNDAVTMLLATLGVAAVLAGLRASGGASLLAAAAIKPSALVLLPFPLLATLSPRSLGPRLGDGRGNLGDGRGNRLVNPGGRRFVLGVALAAVVIGVAAYLGFGWDWTHAFGLAGENQGRTSHLSVPVTFGRLTGLGTDAARTGALVLYALAFAALMAWTWRGGDWVRAAAWASFGLLLATSWLLPWYLIWALPLVAISRDRPLALLTLALTAYQLGARIPL
jgi:Glycosyltransferase family 87